MDKYSLRHLMAAIIVSEELKVPNIRQGDAWLADDRLRKQFTALLQNTYCITDLMLELGDLRYQEELQQQKERQQQDLQGPPY